MTIILQAHIILWLGKYIGLVIKDTFWDTKVFVTNNVPGKEGIRLMTYRREKEWNPSITSPKTQMKKIRPLYFL